MRGYDPEALTAERNYRIIPYRPHGGAVSRDVGGTPTRSRFGPEKPDIPTGLS